MQKHITVLLNEAVENLALKPDSVVVDCTLGAAGHAKRILEELGSEGIYLGIDADESAVTAARKLLKDAKAKIILVNDNFSNLSEIVTSLPKRPTAILADLGWRTDQFEDGQKGFSFSANEPLLMTYGDPEKHLFTASDIVNDWEEESIADVIYGYGEERAARRIARAIVEARAEKPITTAKELSDIVEKAIPPRGHSRIHPATKTFQALRIAVNDELGVLKKLLEDGFLALRPGGHFAIISFHSLEDRLVKNFFRDLATQKKAERITKKPITPSTEEQKENPRARSAKLRIIKKL